MRKKEIAWNARGFEFWSTALAGTFSTGSKHRVWQHGGEAFVRFLRKIEQNDLDDLMVIAHSHGGNVAAYGLSFLQDRQIGCLVTVDTPNRKDMEEVWLFARPRVKKWIHLKAKLSWVKWLGQRGRFNSNMALADDTIDISGGHSGVVKNYNKNIHQWDKIINLVNK